MMSGSFGMGWGNGGTGFAMIPMFLWWALIMALVVVFVRWLISRRDDRDRAPASRALEILAERYARGEIRKDEFDATLVELTPRRRPSRSPDGATDAFRLGGAFARRSARECLAGVPRSQSGPSPAHALLPTRVVAIPGA